MIAPGLVRLLILTAGIAVTVPALAASPGAGGAQELRPGDARFDSVLRRLMQEGAHPIPNEPACPKIGGDKRAAPRTVSIADALAGAMSRESRRGKPLRFSLRCNRAGNSDTIEECRLLVTAAGGDQESSAGFAFEAQKGSAKIDMTTVRCTMSP